MGVHGLWKLIEPSGRMVPLESMADKVLAVDVSIWLHQAMKGMHDTHGAPVAVAHLLILFHRLCKLLFYKIKPIFVFDGGVPALKRQTMTTRKQKTAAAKTEAQKVRGKLLKNLLKHEAVRQVLANEEATSALGLGSFTLPGPAIEEDLFKLPEIAEEKAESSTSEEDVDSEVEERHVEDIHSVDVKSREFLNLPAEIRHEILTELIDTRKQSSWKHLDEMPKQSDNFSDFQMSRLLKRHAVQVSLEQAGKEMGGKSLSLQELEELLGDKGVFCDAEGILPSKRIAQDSVTRYMLVHRDSVAKPLDEMEEVKKKPEMKEEKKFDIEEHLRDVEWSSESDVEIIEETEGIKNEINDESNEELSQQEIYRLIKNNAVPEQSKNLQDSSTKLLNIRNVDKSVAEIIQVLEGDDIGESSIATSSGSSSDLIKSLNETNTNVETEMTVNILKTPGENRNDVKDKAEHSQIASVAPLEITKTIEENRNDVKDKAEHSQIASVAPLEITKITEQIDPELEIIQKVPEETKQISKQDTIDLASSSDSDNDDFVAIEEPVEKSDDNEYALNSLKTEDKAKNTNIEVLVDPSKIQDGDDIFADVFTTKENNSQKVSDLNTCDNLKVAEIDAGEELEKLNREIERLNEEIEEETDEQSEDEKEKIPNEFNKEMSENDLLDLQKSIEDEQSDLLAEQGKQERYAQSVTEQMRLDAQELLRLFGVPFVVAPMEAEAQCAILDMLDLTEGTITDDSDIWLFGGRVVYKNFFNQKKHVLEYRSVDIQKYFKLSREEMIRLAMLVGSDYTTGLSGVGPVTALEILATFPSSADSGILSGLQKFRDWISGDSVTGPPRTTLRKKIKNASLIPGFPSHAVVEAYLHPQVDDSKEPFSWAKPNLTLLQNYTKIKFGWSSERCNELLLPVMKKLLENTVSTRQKVFPAPRSYIQNQTTIDRYFKVAPKSSLREKILSKRVEKAVERLGRKASSSSESEPDESKRAKKRKMSKPEETFSAPKASTSYDKSKESAMKSRLHKETKIPQKEATQKILDDRKKKAIEIFKSSAANKKRGNNKKKAKLIVEKEVKLSESSSDGD